MAAGLPERPGPVHEGSDTMITQWDDFGVQDDLPVREIRYKLLDRTRWRDPEHGHTVDVVTPRQGAVLVSTPVD